ncbi:protein of unknown function (plasmid) [Cupriavidus taiwanensis]|uniref:Uncharacterized protein n=1 Tax=Cupriavidus taiwanensis TaxID=164546 RepID=A0A375IP37_9BURK|nr:protein of unknown function [Cupriavidus taiwanensis]
MPTGPCPGRRYAGRRAACARARRGRPRRGCRPARPHRYRWARRYRSAGQGCAGQRAPSRAARPARRVRTAAGRTATRPDAWPVAAPAPCPAACRWYWPARSRGCAPPAPAGWRNRPAPRCRAGRPARSRPAGARAGTGRRRYAPRSPAAGRRTEHGCASGTSVSLPAPVNEGTGMGRVLMPAGVQRLLPRKIYPARRPRQGCHSCPRREFVLHRCTAGGRASIPRRVPHLTHGTLPGRAAAAFPAQRFLL